jgi:hypothetical protein
MAWHLITHRDNFTVTVRLCRCTAVTSARVRLVVRRHVTKTGGVQTKMPVLFSTEQKYEYPAWDQVCTLCSLYTTLFSSSERRRPEKWTCSPLGYKSRIVLSCMHCEKGYRKRTRWIVTPGSAGAYFCMT